MYNINILYILMININIMKLKDYIIRIIINFDVLVLHFRKSHPNQQERTKRSGRTTRREQNTNLLIYL